MNSLAGNAKLSRRRALRELLMRAQLAHQERLVGLGAIRSDDRGLIQGDEMDVASEHAEAETHARLIEHRWSTKAVLDRRPRAASSWTLRRLRRVWRGDFSGTVARHPLHGLLHRLPASTRTHESRGWRRYRKLNSK